MVVEKSHEMIQTAQRVGVNMAYGTDAFPAVQLSEFDLRAKVLPSPVILQHATCNGGELDRSSDISQRNAVIDLSCSESPGHGG